MKVPSFFVGCSGLLSCDESKIPRTQNLTGDRDGSKSAGKLRGQELSWAGQVGPERLCSMYRKALSLRLTMKKRPVTQLLNNGSVRA